MIFLNLKSENKKPCFVSYNTSEIKLSFIENSNNNTTTLLFIKPQENTEMFFKKFKMCKQIWQKYQSQQLLCD